MKNKSNTSLSLRKVLLSTLAVAPLAILPAPLWALPSTANTNVTSNSAATTFDPVSLTGTLFINDTSTNRLVLKWGRFGSTMPGTLNPGDPTGRIDTGETVRWNLPSAASAVLNIVSTGVTTVSGTLSSNGQVFIINPNGITLDGTSSVSTAGLALSTISESEFTFLNSGSLALSGPAPTTGVSVLTGATINVGSTGNILLAGNSANLAGTINGSQLTITTQNASGPGGGLVTLGNGGSLTVGTNFANPNNGYGNVTINAVGAVNLAATGNTVTVRGGTLTANTTGGAVTAPGTLVVGDTNGEGNVNIDAGTTNNVTLSNVAAASNKRLNLQVKGQTVGITAATTNTGDVRLGTSAINGDLTINAGNGSITSNGDTTLVGGVARTVTLSAPAASKSITFSGTGGDYTFAQGVGTPISVAGNSSITLLNRTGSITLPAMNVATLTVTAAANITQSGAINNLVAGIPATVTVPTSGSNAGKVTAIGTGNFTTQLYDPAGAAPTVVITDTGAGTGATAPLVTVNPDGTLTFEDFTPSGTGYVAATTTAVLNGGVPLANQSRGTSTFDSNNGTITLGQANNFGRLVLKNAPGGINVTDALGNLNLANGTNVTGAATIGTSAGGVIFGTASNSAITFGSSLNLTATNGNISDLTNNITVTGAASFTATGAASSIILDGSSGTGVGLANRFGQVSAAAGTGGIRLYENTTLNLNTVTTTGALRVYSAAGDVITSGAVTATGILVGAGSGAAPGNITLNSAGSSYGTVTILDDFTLLANTAGPGTGGDPIGNYLARDVTINSGAAVTLASINSTSNSGLLGTLDITGSSISIPNRITVGGNVNLTSSGAITANNEDNAFGTLNLTSTGGNIDVRSGSVLLVNATLNGGGSTAKVTGQRLTLGNINSSNSGQLEFVTTDNGTSSMADSVAGIKIFGNVFFNSAGSVTINRAGHSFGRVQVTAGNGRNATIVEGGTLRLGAATVGGSFTATSTSGDILHDSANANGIVLGNGNTNNTNLGTFSAPAGRVSLDDTGNTLPRVAVTAAGDVIIAQAGGRPLGLANVSTGGTLTVSTTGSPIAQVAGSRLNVFGTTSFTNTGANDINIGNSGNRMGGVIARSGSGNVNISENTTLNLKSVATTGNFSATSEAGSVIDSADSTLTVANSIIVAGTSSFSAPAGNISLGLAGSDFAAVSLNTTGNVTLLDSIGNLAFAASTVGGKLDVISTPTSAFLSQTGALNVSGDVSLTTNSGNIDFSNTANQLGAVRFTANNVTLAEATTLNLRAGSVATGQVTFNTGANFVTSGTGGSSFTNNLIIQAGGTITPGPGSLLVIGQFTVFSNNAKDLSGLSRSGNLANRDPVNQGSGTYTAPSP